MINAKSVKWETIQNWTDLYFNELCYKNDGFHSDMIFDGEPYTIDYNGETIGFFSLGDSWDGGKMFRMFYILPTQHRKSRSIFEKMSEEFDIEAALVASNDAHLISLAFEKMNALGTGFDMQAFNFIYGKPERKAEFGRECIHKVNDLEQMNRLTEGQWDGMFDNKHNQFYELIVGNEILGFGAISSMGYNKKCVDIGNYVLPEHRLKGVGRSLLISLGEIAIEQGFVPVAGCWYGNTESIAALTSAGFIPENRLFYVRFK